jgi:hypothetical protein
MAMCWVADALLDQPGNLIGGDTSTVGVGVERTPQPGDEHPIVFRDFSELADVTEVADKIVEGRPRWRRVAPVGQLPSPFDALEVPRHQSSMSRTETIVDTRGEERAKRPRGILFEVRRAESCPPGEGFQQQKPGLVGEHGGCKQRWG